MWHFIILKFINIIIIVIIVRALSDLSTPSNAFTMRVAKKFSGRGKNTRKLPYFLTSLDYMPHMYNMFLPVRLPEVNTVIISEN